MLKCSNPGNLAHQPGGPRWLGPYCLVRPANFTGRNLGKQTKRVDKNPSCGSCPFSWHGRISEGRKSIEPKETGRVDKIENETAAFFVVFCVIIEHFFAAVIL